MKIKVGLVDDHQLFLKSVGLMLETLGAFEVVVEALNGKDLQQKLALQNSLPDLMLIDVSMPVMDGVATAQWLREAHPSTRLVALSMNDKDSAIIRMFKAGCCAYLLKDVHPTVFEKALHEVHEKGWYNTDAVQFNPGRLLLSAEKEIVLNTKEQLFLKLACTEMTYKEVAAEMGVTERAVDNHREALFQKFQVQSRVGLCLEALRKEFVSL